MFNVKIFWNRCMEKYFLLFIQFCMKCFPSYISIKYFLSSPSTYDRRHFCSILTNLSNLSHYRWTFWTFTHTSSDLKNVLTKDFPMQLFANVLQIRCYCKFPNNHKKYLCWSLFLIHVLIKLQDWWPATLLKKRPQHMFFPVNILKCLKKTFCGTPPVIASENGFEKFLRISKGALPRNNLYDLTNLNI